MKCDIKKILLFLTISLLIKESIQDLPVHCLVDKIEGDWLIHMTDNDSDSDLSCGHKAPDQNLDHYNVDVEKTFKKKFDMIVSLERPNKVLATVDKTTELGKWTMVYDEGFEFTINDNVFFAFSRYKKVGKFSASNTDTEDTPGYKNECDKTFIGWFHNIKTNENWGCFWAEKINQNKLDSFNLNVIDYNNIFKFNNIPSKDSNSDNSNNLDSLKSNFIKKQNKKSDVISLLNEVGNKNEDEKSQEIQPVKKAPLKKNKIKVENGAISGNSYVDFIKSLGWDNSSTNNSVNIPHLDIYFMNNFSDEKTSNNQGNFLSLEEKTKFFQPDMDYVNKVNDPQSGYLWKAKVYDEFKGKSYLQMRSLLGSSHYLKSQCEIEEEISNFLELEIKVGSKSELKSELKNKSKTETKSQNHFDHLPENFEWRNIDGANYDSPVRKQGECGSCYAIAAVSVLEARIRIKSTNRLKPILSPSSIISCSKYNQGCAGGYPYLVGKHGKEHGFVEESCQPYTETDDKCFNYCFHQKKWKIKDYGYVGGYYGGCDEESMMKEIYENGPIIVAINATPELYYYSTGIFHSEAKKTEGKNEKGVHPWEYTNHAVVCIGWGEEIINDNLVKFWLLKNSWGEQWGEKGYFRMNKGTNMASVEAQGVFISPDLD